MNDISFKRWLVKWFLLYFIRHWMFIILLAGVIFSMLYGYAAIGDPSGAMLGLFLYSFGVMGIMVLFVILAKIYDVYLELKEQYCEESKK